MNVYTVEFYHYGVGAYSSSHVVIAVSEERAVELAKQTEARINGSCGELREVTIHETSTESVVMSTDTYS